VRANVAVVVAGRLVVRVLAVAVYTGLVGARVTVVALTVLGAGAGAVGGVRAQAHAAGIGRARIAIVLAGQGVVRVDALAAFAAVVGARIVVVAVERVAAAALRAAIVARLG